MRYLIIALILTGCGSTITTPSIPIFELPDTSVLAVGLDAGTKILPYCCNVACYSSGTVDLEPCVARPLQPCRGDMPMCVYSCDKGLDGTPNGFGREFCTDDGEVPGATGPYNCICPVYNGD